MYKPHYPQRICLTSIYSHDEYNIFNIMLLVMSNNIRRMRVCRDSSLFPDFHPGIFLGIFLVRSAAVIRSHYAFTAGFTADFF